MNKLIRFMHHIVIDPHPGFGESGAVSVVSTICAGVKVALLEGDCGVIIGKLVGDGRLVGKVVESVGEVAVDPGKLCDE